MLATILTLFFTLAAVTCSGILLGYLWNWFHVRPTAQDETVYVHAGDGWRLALHRYRAEGTSTGLPIILCHGLSANRYAFDLPDGPSLALFLRRHGRDVWVAELRGSGMSDRPGLLFSDVPYSWDFEDHLNSDLPAIVDCVLRRTGSSLAHWVGHSMGGMLILAYVARTRNPKLASVIALGSPTNFSALDGKRFGFLLRLKSVLELLPVSPFPFVARLAAPLAPWVPAFVFGVFHPDNIEPKVARSLVALMAEPVTSSRLWLDFGRFLETGRFGPKNGKPYLESPAESPVPVLALAGSLDGLAPPESVRPVCTPSEAAVERSCLIAGKETGFAEDYGHMDLILGIRAETEVFPRILAWLQAHDDTCGNLSRGESAPENAGFSDGDK